MIYWTSTEVLLNLVAPLDSAVPSLDFEQINVFWTSGFDSVSIVFNSLSVSRCLLNCIPCIRFKCSFIWPWENQYMVHGFDSISITQFPLRFAQFQQKTPEILLLTRFRSFCFWLWVKHFCLTCVHLPLVYLSAQVSHTWSDFCRSFRVMISEIRILFTSFWFYCHWLWWSSCHPMLALFLLSVFLVWIFSWHHLFQITGTDDSCVLFHNLFLVHNLWASHALFCPLRQVCCIIGITLCRFTSHFPLFVFGSIW